MERDLPATATPDTVEQRLSTTFVTAKTGPRRFAAPQSPLF